MVCTVLGCGGGGWALWGWVWLVGELRFLFCGVCVVWFRLGFLCLWLGLWEVGLRGGCDSSAVWLVWVLLVVDLIDCLTAVFTFLWG